MLNISKIHFGIISPHKLPNMRHTLNHASSFTVTEIVFLLNVPIVEINLRN